MNGCVKYIIADVANGWQSRLLAFDAIPPPTKATRIPASRGSRLVLVRRLGGSLVMKTFSRLIICASLLAGASGCDTLSGVRRTVIVQQLPSPAVVTAALRAVPGVKSIEPKPVEASPGWSLCKGVIHDPPFDQFLYRADPLAGVVKTREAEDGTKTVERRPTLSPREE
jgi:hypothetical protein